MTALASRPYVGPAGVPFSHDELLIIWAYLTRLADSENAPVREKIKLYLEARGEPLPKF